MRRLLESLSFKLYLKLGRLVIAIRLDPGSAVARARKGKRQ